MGKIKALVTELGEEGAAKYLHELKIKKEKEKKDAKVSSLRILPKRDS